MKTSEKPAPTGDAELPRLQSAPENEPPKPGVNGAEPLALGGPPRYAYQVAPLHTIQCKRGTLRPGAEVRPSDVGGRSKLEALVGSGTVLRGPLARAKPAARP